MKPADVVVIGGGVIGLSVAHALAREGASCSLIDRGPLGREASWAGAGIISPGSTIDIPLPMARLRTLSARLFPDWSRSLADETGIDNGYRPCGGLDVALTPTEEHNLRAAAGRWRIEGIAHEFLPGDDVRRAEPAIGPDVRSGVLIPGRAQVRNPRHLQALASSCLRHGVSLWPGRAALGFERATDRILAVQTPSGPLHGGTFILAAGAWSAALAQPIGVDLATPPVKGQIVLLRHQAGRLNRVIEHRRNYLVPRDDGRVLVGATEEDAGFDTRPTSGALLELLALATRLCPELASSECERSWAGLRPGSRDTRPYIGPVPDFANLLVATGHGRAGLQLSPGTAALVADLVMGRPPALPLDDFRPDRPAADPEPDAFRS